MERIINVFSTFLSHNPNQTYSFVWQPLDTKNIIVALPSKQNFTEICKLSPILSARISYYEVLFGIQGQSSKKIHYFHPESFTGSTTGTTLINGTLQNTSHKILTVPKELAGSVVNSTGTIKSHP